MYSKAEKPQNSFSEFKNSEKHYRSLQPPYADPYLIDFKNPLLLKEHGIVQDLIADKASGTTFEAYRFSFPKGFIVVKNFLSLDQQLKAAQQCITDLCRTITREAA